MIKGARGDYKPIEVRRGALKWQMMGPKEERKKIYQAQSYGAHYCLDSHTNKLSYTVFEV